MVASSRYIKITKDLVRPFRALIPKKIFASDVAALPYDVVDTPIAKETLKKNKYSFLSVSRAEATLKKNEKHIDTEVYERAKRNFKDLIKNQILIRDKTESYYIWRIQQDDIIQIGVGLAASLEFYDSGRIKKHELTRLLKENDRYSHIKALNAQTGPALLIHPDNEELETLLTDLIKRKPLIDIGFDNGFNYSIWRVSGIKNKRKITSIFNSFTNMYIADGHHRSAAAYKLYSERSKKTADHINDSFLAVAFPEKSLKLYSYNRAISSINGLSTNEFLHKLKSKFLINEEKSKFIPKKQYIIGLYISGTWYKLTLKKEEVCLLKTSVEKLDVNILNELILKPIIGIKNIRSDNRIEFIGGLNNLKKLENLVDSGSMRCSFSLHPTSVKKIITVSNEGLIMPPKSTWFEPKLLDGLFSLVLD